MKEVTIYDKVSWHYPNGKNCPSLEAAKRHFEILMKWLMENNLLSDEGKEAFEAGIDSDFSITSSMLNDKGNKILERCYARWLKSIDYSGNINIKILEDCLKNENCK